MTEQELKQVQAVWDKIAGLIGISDICDFGDESRLDGISVGEMKLFMRYVVTLSNQINEARSKMEKRKKQDEIASQKKELKVALDEDGYTQTERIAFKHYCNSMKECYECPANSYCGPCIEHFVHNTYSNYIRKHKEIFDSYCIGRRCEDCQYENVNECFVAFLEDMEGNTI